MLEVEKKIALVKSWIENLEFSSGKLNIKYIIDKKNCLEVEISKSNLIWSVLVNSPDFAPYRNVWIEVLDLDNIDNYYILSWGDDISTIEDDIINKLNETIILLLK
ncbi:MULTISPECIES: hypothetical protein [unclassified Streptococcus]|uniref:hypothetical protein n=1 Tax=unclassified Streptococcus TaxID=2608887 RepID=UPI001072ACC6|nr:MULTISPECIES: hypothetical protein [unclassified Streptococcus]MBF0786850.1 hypothetical protein [Streptococcus sp. 19428wC2_LYSM12]MCQ9212739.1 hypothetical protein [Streptococcus sp. B01]MCQ9214080.1 hypothetical protein [Streptococcus sp. O1]TFV06220.1 hypothetical protein E4T79_02835 [Streptococcus sp. LYSM12]